MIMKIYIKNMVCRRCKAIVKGKLNKLGIAYISVEIGEAVIREDLSTKQLDLLGTAIGRSGLELISIEGITIEKYIINHKIELVKQFLIYNKLNMTEIARKMHYSSRAKLSSQFKSITGHSPLQFRHLRLSNSHHPESN